MPLIAQNITDAVATVAIDAVLSQWKAQGHNLTGKFIRSIEYKVRKQARSVDVEVYFQRYGIFTNQGVPASRIPFSRGSGARSSKYIEGLKSYAVQRFGVSRQEAERIAFAIATKHKREGMPTFASKAYSQTGRRTGFVDEALQDSQEEIERIIRDGVALSYQVLIENFYNQILRR